MQKELMSIKSFCEIYDISNTRLYALVKKKEITLTKLEGRRFITRIEAERWLTALLEENK